MQNLPQIQNANVESLSTREDLEKDDEDCEQFSISLFCIYSSFLEFGMLSLICIPITMYTINIYIY